MKAFLYQHIVIVILLSLLALSGSPLPAQARSAHPGSDFGVIDRYVLAQMHQAQIPGLALGIIHNDQIVHLRGFGVANAAGQPVTPHTPFILGSLSKSFTALAIMQLVEAGKMDLDVPVQRYLPWFRVADRQASDQITVRHLLYQTSGLPPSAGEEPFAGTGQASLEQRVRELRTVALSLPVGQFQYSNTNYEVLGLLIQVVSGQTYGAYIQQHIFAPLQMHHSFVSQGEALQAGMATGYRWWFGLPVPASLPYLSDQLPAAFLISSAEDMSHYLIAHMTNGSYLGTRVLADWGMVELHQASAVVSESNDNSCYYGMGWFTSAMAGVPTLWHTGATANFYAVMVLVPDNGWGIVLLVNANGSIAQDTAFKQITQGVIGLLVGRQPPSEGISFSQLYISLDLAILLLSVLQIGLLVKVLRWRKRVEHLERRPGVLVGYVLLTAGEIVIPLALVIGLPLIVDTSWSFLLLYQPDITFWLIAMMLLSAGTAITQAVLLVIVLLRRRAQSRGEPNREESNGGRAGNRPCARSQPWKTRGSSRQSEPSGGARCCSTAPHRGFSVVVFYCAKFLFSDAPKSGQGQCHAPLLTERKGI